MARVLPEVQLERVTYVGTEGDGWALDVRFHSDAPPGPTFDYFTQLFAEPGLSEPVGERVPTSGDASGQWSEQAAGVELQPGVDYWLAVLAVAKGPPFAEASNGVAIVREAPTLTGGSFDGRHLDVVWTPPASQAVNDYRARVETPEGVVLETELGSAGYALAGGARTWRFDLARLPLERLAGPLRLVVAAQASSPPALATGPEATTTFAALAPVVTGAGADPVSGRTTVAWDAVPGAGGYLVQRYLGGLQDGQPLTVEGSSVELGDPLPPNAEVAVAVAPVAAEAPGLPGPFCEPVGLPAACPRLTSAFFDGARLHVDWVPVAGSTGYRASVLLGDDVVSQATAGAGDTSLAFDPAAPDPAAPYTVVLQALAGDGAGPPTPPRPLATPALAVSSQPASEAYPHLVPLWGLAPAPAPIVVHLPAIGATDPVEVPPFTLAPAGDAALPFTLTVDGEEVWTFGTEPVRAGLRTTYVEFLEAAEEAGTTPAGVALLQLVLSRLLPQTFAESLYYAYGFDPASSSVDLRPGLVLRVAVGGYNAVPLASPKWVAGYAASATVDYEIASYRDSAGRWRLGSDAFVALLAANELLAVQPPQTLPGSVSEAGAADAADLFFPGFRQPFARLFVPAKLEDPSAPGNADAPRQFTLAAAPTFAALQATRPSPSGNQPVAYFRGRAVAKPCIRVAVDGTAHTVELGTTLGSLLERLARRPPGAPIHVTGLRVERSIGPAVLGQAHGYDAARSYPVLLGRPKLAVYGPDWDALALPLLHGDRVTLAGG